MHIGELLRAVDKQLFPPLIANNCNLQNWIRVCREKRTKHNQDHERAQALTDENLLSPDNAIFNLRAKREYDLASASIRATFGALTPEEREAQPSDLESQLAACKERIEATRDSAILDAHDAYIAKNTARNAALITLRSTQNDLKHLYTFESVLNIFLNADRQIFSIIQKAVNTHCPSLKSILQGTVRVPNTQDELLNPWENQSLCGITCILHERFHKRSFITFNNYLLEAMSFHLSEADTKASPTKAITEVTQMMHLWDQRDLWAQMSPDYFFSAILLRSLHPATQTRNNLLQATQRFLRDQQSSSLSRSTDKHPLFSFTTQYLQSIQDSKTFISNNSTLPRQPQSNNPAPTLARALVVVLNLPLQPAPL
jgi:hypothetical protein